MIVVDSNVIAYCWINGERTALAHRLRRLDPDWHAPVLWRSELRNILTGYRRDEVIGHPISVFEVQENPQQIAIHIQRIRRMGRDRFTARHRTRNGTLVDLDVSVVYIPILDQFAAFLRPAPAEDTR